MKKILCLLNCLLVIGFFSCKKYLDNVKPAGQLSLQDLANTEGVQSLLTGAYGAIDGYLEYPFSYTKAYPWHAAPSNWIYGSIAAGDAHKGSDPGDQSDGNLIEDYTVNAANSFIRGKWWATYEGITRCNNTLKALKMAVAANTISATTAKQVEAEAKFLRGHYYFEAKKMWNMVPYIDENTTDFRTPNNVDIWPKIEADFQFGVTNLPTSQSDLGRATKWAAEAYLGKALLFQKKYSAALASFNDIINNGPFSLVTNYSDNYNASTRNNAESIFEIEYAVNDGATEGQNGGFSESLAYPFANSGAPSGCCGFFQPSQNLVNAFKTTATGLPLTDTYNNSDFKSDFSNGIYLNSSDAFTTDQTSPVDARLDWSVGRRGVPYLDWGLHPGKDFIRDKSGVYGPYSPIKNVYYKSQQGSLVATYSLYWRGSANNFRLIRLAHVLLWAAECEIEVGSLAKAQQYVDQVRARAKNTAKVKLPDGSFAANYLTKTYSENGVSFASQGQDFARKAVRFEHRLEFAMEGHRFFDLVRWGIAATEINNYIAIEKSKAALLVNAHFTAGKNEYYPIPQEQIDNSVVNGKSTLTQNPGY